MNSLRLTFFFVLIFSSITRLHSKTETHAFRIIISPYSMSINTGAGKRAPSDGNRIKVVVENSSLSDVWGKVETVEGDLIEFINIPNEQGRSVDIQYKKGRIYKFTSLSPSYQDAILNPGGKSYEIPAKKSD